MGGKKCGKRMEFVWRSSTSKFNIDKSLGKENHESGEREMS